MIIEIPNKDDFQKSGLSMLNLAWDSIATMYRKLDDSGIEEWNENGEVKGEFWEAAQRPISVSLALAQQGIELLIKSRIAEISPYLLLSGSPREWPSNCSNIDTPYADFKTIDAHELIRAHDTVVNQKLDTKFKQQVEDLRRLRNIIFHGVDNNKISPEFVFKIILEASHNLIQPLKWVKLRREYLENTPESAAFSPDFVEGALILEFIKVINILNPADCKRLLGFDKKQRAYICYDCSFETRDMDIKPYVAQLNPNTPDSNQIYCFVCDKITKVIRHDCSSEECPGNVIRRP